MIKNNKLLTMALFVGAIALTTQVMAHNGAMGIVKERMDAMAILGDHAKAVGDMLKGKRAFELDAVDVAAQAFIEHGERIPKLFPDTEDSRLGPGSEALPAIWERWDEFSSLATQFTEDSRSLASIVSELSSGELSANEQSRTIRSSFFKTVKNCSACHENFRLDQD